MSATSLFFEQLEQLTGCHRVHRHAFIERLAHQRLTLAQLQAFAIQHYAYARCFARNLAAVIANTPDEDARTLLVLNMYEEIGEPSRIRDRVHMLLLEAELVTGGQLGSAFERLASEPHSERDVVSLLVDTGIISRSQVAALVEQSTRRARDLTHPALFRRFLRSIQLVPEDVARLVPLPATLEFMNTYQRICREAHWLEALGAMGPGTECIIAGLYAKILAGVVGSGLVEPADYVFWSLHVHCDEGHGRNILECMRPYAHERENQERIVRGALSVLDARALWFDSLDEAVFGGADPSLPATPPGAGRSNHLPHREEEYASHRQ